MAVTHDASERARAGLGVFVDRTPVISPSHITAALHIASRILTNHEGESQPYFPIVPANLLHMALSKLKACAII